MSRTMILLIVIEDSEPPSARGTCTRCRHPWNLHGNGGTCRAKGCDKGPDGTPCPEFTP